MRLPRSRSLVKTAARSMRYGHFERDGEQEITERPEQAGACVGILQEGDIVAQADETGGAWFEHVEIGKRETQRSQDGDGFKEQDPSSQGVRKRNPTVASYFPERTMFERFGQPAFWAQVSRFTVNMPRLLGECLINQKSNRR